MRNCKFKQYSKVMNIKPDYWMKVNNCLYQSYLVQLGFTMKLTNLSPVQYFFIIDIEGIKIDCSSLFVVPATSAAQNRLLFFFFLLRPFTVLMKKTRAIKQSIIFRCLSMFFIHNQ